MYSHLRYVVNTGPSRKGSKRATFTVLTASGIALASFFSRDDAFAYCATLA